MNRLKIKVGKEIRIETFAHVPRMPDNFLPLWPLSHGCSVVYVEHKSTFQFIQKCTKNFIKFNELEGMEVNPKRENLWLAMVLKTRDEKAGPSCVGLEVPEKKEQRSHGNHTTTSLPN